MLIFKKTNVMHTIFTVEIHNNKKVFVPENNIRTKIISFMTEYLAYLTKQTFCLDGRVIFVLRKNEIFDQIQFSIVSKENPSLKIRWFNGLKMIRKDIDSDKNLDFYHIPCEWFEVGDVLAFLYKKEYDEFLEKSILFK